MQNVAMCRRFTDLREVDFSCKQRFQFNYCLGDKATKQSRDLKCVYVFIHDTFTIT